MIVTSRGLGSTYLTQDQNGNVIDCAYPQNWFNPYVDCLTVLTAGGSTVTQPNLPSPPPPALPGAPKMDSAGNALEGPDQVAALAYAKTLQQNQDFFTNLANQNVAADCTATWMPPYCNSTVVIWGAIAAGVVYLLGQGLKRY